MGAAWRAWGGGFVKYQVPLEAELYTCRHLGWAWRAQFGAGEVDSCDLAQGRPRAKTRPSAGTQCLRPETHAHLHTLIQAWVCA